MKKTTKRSLLVLLALLTFALGLTGCGSSPASAPAGQSAAPTASAKKVVIYTNADKEATDAMQKTLDASFPSETIVVKPFSFCSLVG